MKRVIAVVLAVALLLIAAVALVGMPTGPLVAAINRQLEPNGYRIRIDGAAKISLWPAIDIVADDVAVNSIARPAAKDLLAARSVRIGLSFKDLFGGKIHVTSIAIVRPVIQNEFGKGQRGRPANSRGAGDNPFHGVAVDRVVVEDGTLISRDARTGAEVKITGLQLAATHVDGPLDVRADAQLGLQRLHVEAKTDPSFKFVEGKPIPFDATVEAPGLLQRPATISASVNLSGDLLALDEITGSAGGSRLFGMVSVDFSGIVPLLNAELEVERLDLTALTEQASGQVPRSADSAWSDRPIDLAGLNFINARVKVSARELRIDKVRIEPARLTMSVDDGVLAVVPTRLELYGGEAKGKLVIDASGQTPAYAAQVDLTNVAAMTFLDDAFDFRNLDGRGRMKAELKASGASSRAIFASLAGTADIAFENGAIKGVSVPQLVQSVASHILSGWQGNPAGSTDFVTFSATFRIDGGKASTDNMLIVGPLLRSPGKGVVDLNTLTLDFRVDPKVVLEQAGASRNPAGIGVPVVIRGPWASPQIYPELAGILENPDAAYAGLKNIFDRFTPAPGTAPNSPPTAPNLPPNAPPQDSLNSLIEGLGSMFGPQKPPQSRADDPPSVRPNERPPARPEERPQSRADDQERAREFLKNLFRN